MSTPPANFLTSLAQTIAAMTLYEHGHPSRDRAMDDLFSATQDMQSEQINRRFTFLDDEILIDHIPLAELGTWTWASKLSAAGVQRLEFVGPVSLEDLEGFVEEVYARINKTALSTEARPMRNTNIRYGTVGLKSSGSYVEEEQHRKRAVDMGFSLSEEVDALSWIQEEIRGGSPLRLVEVEALVSSLAVAMHGDHEFVLPLLKVKDFDQYTTTHSMNVAMLSMAFAEFIEVEPRLVRAIGVAGAMHDLGKVEVPIEILTKPGRLTDEEREAINLHPVAGARLILEADEKLDLAAAVAYEHHVRIDGGGYPNFKYPRLCHPASDLLHICDVYDALGTNRPYREAWEPKKILGLISEGAGTEFDKELSEAFLQMMEEMGSKIAVLEATGESIPRSEPAESVPEEPQAPPASGEEESVEAEAGEGEDDTGPVDRDSLELLDLLGEMESEEP